MNQVDVDAAALAAEAAAVPLPDAEQSAAQADGTGTQAAPLAGELLEPSMEQLDEMAKRTDPVLGHLVLKGAQMFAPNWQVTRDEAHEFGHAVGMALAAWFPTEIPPKYAVLLNVGMQAWGMVESRRDPVTGALRPIRAAKGASAASAATAEGAMSGNGFSTAA